MKKRNMEGRRKSWAAMLAALALGLTACAGKAPTGDASTAAGTAKEEGTAAKEETTKEKEEAKGLFSPGTYEASAQGFGGLVSVKVTVTEGEITEVAVVGDQETPSLGGVAVESMGKAMVAAQTPNVDMVAGATVTSKAIIEAAKEALTSAGADLAVLDANRKDTAAGAGMDKKEETLETEIVIIGAGGAGMTAAISATQAGKNVILLEKMAYAGGNTTKATGGMNAAETHYQKEQKIEDSVEQFVEDTMAGGKNVNNEELVRVMAENSAEGIDWLDEIGAPLPKVSFSGGATNARIHAPEDGSGVGGYLVEAFLEKIKEQNIHIMYETEATELIQENGAVAGVKASSRDTDYTIKAKAVILATGGFGANEDMYTRYRPDLKGTVTTNAPSATGDGIVMAQKVGADLVDIEQIQLHPTVEQNTSMLITESVRGDGAILVNQSGKRFIDEMKTRDVVSAAELEQEGCYAYIIFDQNLRDHLKAIEKYVANGLTVQGETVEELAGLINVDPATLKGTMETWNQAVREKKDAEFGRNTGMEQELATAPYYAIKVAPGIHHTMGGIKINTSTQTLDKSGNVIPGLFAAGEVTGGVHGANRIGGNAVADIVVFGRLAAESAIAYVEAGK